MTVPNYLQPYLASYDLDKLDAFDQSVRDELITQILNRGDLEATRWIFKNYSLENIKEKIKNPARGTWIKSSLSYWQKIFGINTLKEKYIDAIINLDPYAITSRDFKSKSNRHN